MSKASDIFVDELKASMVQKIANGTINLWKRRAREYSSLTATQWNAVLDRLIAENEGGFMLPWPAIKNMIELVRDLGVGRNLGTMNFTINGNPNNAIRIKYVGDQIISIKTGKKPKPPQGAYNIETHPDYPADPEPHERAEPAWVRELIKTEIMPNLIRMGAKGALYAKEPEPEYEDVPF